MAVAASNGLREILDIRNLPAAGGVAEVRGKLRQLAGQIGIAGGGCRLCGRLQFARDLLRHLLILGGVRLLQLLQSAQYLRER